MDTGSICRGKGWDSGQQKTHFSSPTVDFVTRLDNEEIDESLNIVIREIVHNCSEFFYSKNFMLFS